MDKTIRNGIIEFVVAIILGVVTTIVSNKIVALDWKYTALLSGFVLLTYVTFLFVTKNWRKLRAVNNIGIESVLFDKERPELKDYELKSSGDFAFWGISAKRVIEDLTLRNKLLDISKRGHSIKFLLLDPTSIHLPRKASDENENAEIWKKDIKLSIQKIKEFAASNNINIEVKTYDFLPIWRLIFMNNDLLYVTYFFKGRQGIESPLLKLRDDQYDNLYRAFKFQFEEVWSYQSKNA